MTEKNQCSNGHPLRAAPGAQELRISPVLAFAGAFFSGSLVAAANSVAPVLMLNRAGGPAWAVVWICFACFLGGFYAGIFLWSVVRTRRWPLLWLAAGSPALPVWICTIIALGIGVEMAPWVLRLTVIACVSAVAGAVSSYCSIPVLKRWAAARTRKQDQDGTTASQETGGSG